MFWPRGVGWRPPSSYDLECWPRTSNQQDLMYCMPLLSQKHFPPNPAIPHQCWSSIWRANGQVYWCTFQLELDLVLHLSSLHVFSYPMNAHKSLLCQIISACAIPIDLYWSPFIFSVLLNKDFASIKKCIRLLPLAGGVADTHSCKFLISQHFNFCTRLSTSIINDPLHPLHPRVYKCAANFQHSIFF